MAVFTNSAPFNLGCLCLERLRNFGRPSTSKSSESHLRLSASLKGLHRGPTDLRSFVKRPISPLQAVQQHAESAAELSGTWRKDKSQSDSMHEACEAVQLKWVLRRGLAILNTLEIEDNSDYFQTNIKAGGIMDVVERYPWSGQEKQHSRRDKRGGHHFGKIVKTDRGPSIQVRWNDPFGGVCHDTFCLSQNGQSLTQVTEMTMKTGQQVNYKTVYHRA